MKPLKPSKTIALANDAQLGSMTEAPVSAVVN
jgi:hypothetical protein